MRKFISFIIIICSIVFSVFIYNSTFNVDQSNSNLDIEIGKFLNNDDIKVVKIDKLLRNLYRVVYFETEDISGVSLLKLGWNNEYQIRDVYYTDSELAHFEYIFEKEPYYIIFGKGDKLVSKLHLRSSDIVTTKYIDSKNIFVIDKGEYDWNQVGLVYEGEIIEIMEDEKLVPIHINAGLKLHVPIIGLFLVIFTIFLSILYNHRFSKFRAFESDTLLDGDGRIKQSSWY